MAIKGLTHQAPQFPMIGELRKGAPKPKNSNAPGKDLTYFRFTSTIPEVEATFGAAYGDEPRLINAFLPFRYVDEVWEAWQEEWVAGGLKHRCDGEFVVRVQGGDGTYSDPAPGTMKCPGGCKPAGRLRIVIPELRRLAYVLVLTTSKWDIVNLDAQLRALFEIKQDLRGIPLQLRRRPERKSTPQGKKRVRREMWLLSIEAAPTYVDLQLAAQEAAAIPQLPEGITVLPIEDEVITVHPVTGEILNDGEDWDDETFGAGEDEDAEPLPREQVEQEKTEKVKPASIQSQHWSARGKELAAAEPYYQKDGAPDWFHMTGAAGKLGFSAITDENLDDVLDALRTYAAEQTGKQGALPL